MQQGARQDSVKESSMLKFLGTKKQTLLLDRLFFGEEHSQALDPILSSKMQVWGLGLGPRSVDPHWHKWFCSLPYSTMISLWLWQMPLSPPTLHIHSKGCFRDYFTGIIFPPSFHSSFASLLSCIKCLFSKTLYASNPSVSNKMWMLTCSTFFRSFSETHTIFFNFGLLLEGGPMNASEVLSLLFVLPDHKAHFCPFTHFLQIICSGQAAAMLSL